LNWRESIGLFLVVYNSINGKLASQSSRENNKFSQALVAGGERKFPSLIHFVVTHLSFVSTAAAATLFKWAIGLNVKLSENLHPLPWKHACAHIKKLNIAASKQKWK
jgi:hypothetical protein